MYAAPEVINCLQTDGSLSKHGRGTDIFSLGCVFPEMLSVMHDKSVNEFHNFLLAQPQEGGDRSHSPGATIARGMLLYSRVTDRIALWFKNVMSWSSAFEHSIAHMISAKREDRLDAYAVLHELSSIPTYWTPCCCSTMNNASARTKLSRQILSTAFATVGSATQTHKAPGKPRNENDRKPQLLHPPRRLPSFKTNVERTKTRRWIEAKKVSYDGRDWSKYKENDVYSADEQPPPSHSSTVVAADWWRKQTGQSTAEVICSFTESQSPRGPSFPHGYPFDADDERPAFSSTAQLEQPKEDKERVSMSTPSSNGNGLAGDTHSARSRPSIESISTTRKEESTHRSQNERHRTRLKIQKSTNNSEMLRRQKAEGNELSEANLARLADMWLSNDPLRKVREMAEQLAARERDKRIEAAEVF